MTCLAVKQKIVVNTTFTCKKEKQTDLLELLLTSGKLDLQDIADLLDTSKSHLLDVITGKDFLTPNTSKLLAKWVLLLLQ